MNRLKIRIFVRICFSLPYNYVWYVKKSQKKLALKVEREKVDKFPIPQFPIF